ncbi:hypothetical protein HY837_01305 [archaeon]|nr:hypothetical protein [archaeon]
MMLKKVIFASVICSTFLGIFCYAKHKNQTAMVSESEILISTRETEENSDEAEKSPEELNQILDKAFSSIFSSKKEIDETKMNLRDFLLKSPRAVLSSDHLGEVYNENGAFYYMSDTDNTLSNSDNILICQIASKLSLDCPEDEEISVIVFLDKNVDGSVEELYKGKILKKDLQELFQRDLLNFSNEEIIFDKFKENSIAKSLAELVEVSVMNGPTSLADDCIQKLFENNY